jgi:hypothetical protein
MRVAALNDDVGITYVPAPVTVTAPRSFAIVAVVLCAHAVSSSSRSARVPDPSSTSITHATVSGTSSSR